MSDVRVNVIWNMYRNQSDWQRHNETQRATFSALLLAVETALLGFLPRDHALHTENWPIPAFMMLVGIAGFLAIFKYWERFNYHDAVNWEFETELDTEIPPPENRESLREVRLRGIEAHDSRALLVLQDRYLMQHWIWAALHFFVAGFGCILLTQALANGPLPKP